MSEERCMLLCILQNFPIISVTLIYILNECFLRRFLELMLLTSGLIQDLYILKTGFFKLWEISHWPFTCCVSEPTLTLSGSPTFRPSPASMTLLSTLRRTKFGTSSPHKPSMTSSANTRTRLGSTPTSIKSSR